MPTFFELTLDDTSPVIHYYPFAETLGAPNLLAGWNSYFSQSGFSSQPGQEGSGDSLHITSLDGAVLAIQWFGTGISLFGSVVDATYQVSLDGGEPSIGLPRQDLLVKVQDLEPKQHLLALIAHPHAAASNTLSHIAFNRAALNISTALTGASISSEVLDVISPRWSFSGDWTVRRLFRQGPRSQRHQRHQLYRVSKMQGNTATIVFTGSAVTLTGIRNATHGHYNVTLDGATTRFDGHSDWLETSTLFLQAGLEEAVQHTLTVTNDDNATLAITGINITHVSGGTLPEGASGLSISTGNVIGVVLAIIFGVLAIVTVVICIYFRQRRQRNRKPSFTHGGISSASAFRDLDTGVQIRIGRPTLVSTEKPERASEDMYSSTTAIHAGDGTKSHRDDAEPAAVLVAGRQEESNDPASPLPYLRSSKTFAANAPGGPGREITRSRESGVESVLRDLLAAHMHQDIGIVNLSESPFHFRRQSTVADVQPPQRPHVEIPPGGPTSFSGTPTSQRPRRSPLLLRSPVRGSRRMTQRKSEASNQDSPLPSVSTIQFATPWNERREGAHTDTTSVMADELTPASPPPVSLKHASFDIMDRLRSRVTPKVVVPPGPSNWKPPW